MCWEKLTNLTKFLLDMRLKWKTIGFIKNRPSEEN
jgi:hypothetical protein